VDITVKKELSESVLTSSFTSYNAEQSFANQFAKGMSSTRVEDNHILLITS
jgi:hypothetical protein